MYSTVKRFLYTSLAAFFLLISIVLMLAGFGGKAAMPDTDLMPIFIVGEYRADGGRWQALSDGSEPVKPGYQSISVRGHFSQDIPKNMHLILMPSNLRVLVNVGGETVLNFGEPRTYQSFFQAPEQAIRFYQSPGITSTDLVEMEITNPYASFSPISISRFLTNIFMGYGQEIYVKLLEQHGVGLTMGIIITITGFGMLLLILIFRDSDLIVHGRALSFSFFAVSGGLYVLSDLLHPYLPLLVNNSVLCNLLDVIPIYLITSSLCLYFTANLEQPKLHTFMMILSVFVVCSCAFVFAAQLLGFADLYELQEFAAIPGALCSLCGLICLAYEGLWTRKKNATVVLLTFIPVFVALFLEYINYYWRFIPVRIAAPSGILLTVLLQLIQLLNLAKFQAQQAAQKQKLQNELTQSRIAVMLSQIQPHFLYNALSTIEYLCLKQPEKAAEVVEDFSAYLRGNMDSLTRQGLIPWEDERKHLECYLAIEQLRFPYIDVKYKLAVQNFQLPALTVQPLVENAIRHGLTKSDREDGEKGCLLITTWENENACFISVEDDGAGFDPANQADDGRSHIGISNTRNRLHSMCGGTLQVVSAMGKGTKITISIPKGEYECVLLL